MSIRGLQLHAMLQIIFNLSASAVQAVRCRGLCLTEKREVISDVLWVRPIETLPLSVLLLMLCTKRTIDLLGIQAGINTFCNAT